MRKCLVLSGLIATALAGPAFAQSATGGVAGSASGAGNYGISGNYGSGSASGTGLGTSSAGTGSYTFDGGGLPAGVSGLPSVSGVGSGSGSASLTPPYGRRSSQMRTGEPTVSTSPIGLSAGSLQSQPAPRSGSSSRPDSCSVA